MGGKEFEPVSIEVEGEDERLVTSFEADEPFTDEVRSSGNSKHTGNAQAYYENDDFSLRLAYNYRSQYFVKPDSQSDLVIDDRATLDFKGTYALTQDIMLTFSVTNITDESQEYFFIREQIVAPAGGIPAGQEGAYSKRDEKVAGSHYTTGRNFYAGVNWKF